MQINSLSDSDPSHASQPISYRATINACYVGNFVQAIVVNITPILFIPLREQFGLSFEQLGFLVLVNFVTQVTCDLVFARLIDKYGFRPFLLTAPILTLLGFGLFATAPLIFKDVYFGLILSTIIFSGSGGLLELILSPVVNAIPTDEKASAMSVLHSFYAWGQVTVVLLTTLFLFIFGKQNWQMIIAIWLLVPFINFFMFLKAPLAPVIPDEHRQPMLQVICQPFFAIAFLAIACGGAAEVCIAQWASAFTERGLELPKLFGDIAATCAFAVMLGIGRLLYGIYGNRIDVNAMMRYGALAAVICYLIVALSPFTPLSLIACAFCGIAVSLLWPGTLVVASSKYPMTGAWLFAVLAAGGDIGAAIGPWLLGFITDRAPRFEFIMQWAQDNTFGWNLEQIGLRTGILVGAIFPIGCWLCHRWMRYRRELDLNPQNENTSDELSVLEESLPILKIAQKVTQPE